MDAYRETILVLLKNVREARDYQDAMLWASVFKEMLPGNYGQGKFIESNFLRDYKPIQIVDGKVEDV